MMKLCVCCLMILSIIPCCSIAKAANEINIAFGKLISSRTTLSVSPQAVVDGDKNGRYYSSRGGGFQWILIELLWKYQIEKIIINLKDPDYANMIVSVDNGNFKRRSSIGSITDICLREDKIDDQNPNTTNYFSCNNIVASYVIVLQNSNASKPLVASEVEAYGLWAENYPDMPNVLLNKVIKASARDTNSCIKNLVDGTWFPDCCTEIMQSRYEDNWFKIDMENSYRIDYIAFTIRNSPFASNRAKNFLVGFSDVDFTKLIRDKYPQCGQYQGKINLGSRVTMKCNANLGAYRYIIFQQAYGIADGYFGSCEFEAYPIYGNAGKMWINKGFMLLSSFEISTITASRPSDCLFFCFQLGLNKCDSFNYNKIEQKCQLNQHNYGYPFSSLIKNANWSFYTAVYVADGLY